VKGYTGSERIHKDTLVVIIHPAWSREGALRCQHLRTFESAPAGSYVGLARTIYIRFIYGIFGSEITKNTVIYGVYIRFWPTLLICFLAGGWPHMSVTIVVDSAVWSNMKHLRSKHTQTHTRTSMHEDENSCLVSQHFGLLNNGILSKVHKVKLSIRDHWESSPDLLFIDNTPAIVCGCDCNL